MKIILAFLLLYFSQITYAETISYNTSFRGIKVGSSTMAQIIREYGEPYTKVINTNNVKYIYPPFHVTIQDSTGRVNSIIVLDTNYTDLNGISVGQHKSVVESVLMKTNKNHLVDFHNGIIYWFIDNKVSKIVLAYKLRKN